MATRDKVREVVYSYLTNPGSRYGFVSVRISGLNVSADGYDETLMWKSIGGTRYVVLRPDRFVFAVCNTETELAKAAACLAQLFES
jgi:hypothetical protein